MPEEEHLIGGVVSGGVTYEWNPGPDKAARLDKELEYAIKAGNHFWTAIAMFHLNEQSLADIENEQAHMDMENLMQIHMGCFLCEEPYSAQLAKRRCRGNPPGELKYV